MKVFGDTIDPGKVNAWMKGRASVTSGGYAPGGLVSWHAIEKHKPGLLKKVDYKYTQEDERRI